MSGVKIDRGTDARKPEPGPEAPPAPSAARVAHVTVIHKPLDPRIHVKQCRTLADAGYEVHLLTGGYRSGSWSAEPFTAHPISAAHHRPLLREQPHRQIHAARIASGLGAEIYHLHDPHLIPLGLLLKRRGARVIYDVHEHYHLKAVGKLTGAPLRRAIKPRAFDALEEAARRKFDAFVCASEALAERFPADRTIAINNFPRLSEFSPAPAREPESPPVILYLGGLKRERGFDVLTAVPSHLPPELGARLRIVGEIRPPELASRAASLPGVEVVGEIPREQALAQLPRASIGITVEPPRHNGSEGWRMNKLFEYMAAGLPVVIPDAPRWREIAARYECGLAVDAGDPAAVTTAVERLLRSPELAERLGRNGRRAVLGELNWERQAPRLLDLYERLL